MKLLEQFDDAVRLAQGEFREFRERFDPPAPQSAPRECRQPVDDGQRDIRQIIDQRDPAFDRWILRLAIAAREFLAQATQPGPPTLRASDYRCIHEQPLPLRRSMRFLVLSHLSE